MITASSSFRIYCSTFRENRQVVEEQNEMYTINRELDQQKYKTCWDCSSDKSDCCSRLSDNVSDTLRIFDEETYFWKLFEDTLN